MEFAQNNVYPLLMPTAKYIYCLPSNNMKVNATSTGYNVPTIPRATHK